MKKILALVLGSLLASTSAYAYTSSAGKPDASSPVQEYRVVKKSAIAGFSDAISKGDVLVYTAAGDGYSVSRVGADSINGSHLVACIAEAAIATGDDRLHRCVSKGYVNFAAYDASGTAIALGDDLCPSADGQLQSCASADSDAGIVSLDTKASGTGSDLRIMIRAR